MIYKLRVLGQKFQQTPTWTKIPSGMRDVVWENIKLGHMANKSPTCPSLQTS